MHKQKMVRPPSWFRNAPFFTNVYRLDLKMFRGQRLLILDSPTHHTLSNSKPAAYMIFIINIHIYIYLYMYNNIKPHKKNQTDTEKQSKARKNKAVVSGGVSKRCRLPSYSEEVK